MIAFGGNNQPHQAHQPGDGEEIGHCAFGDLSLHVHSVDGGHSVFLSVLLSGRQIADLKISATPRVTLRGKSGDRVMLLVGLDGTPQLARFDSGGNLVGLAADIEFAEPEPENEQGD